MFESSQLQHCVKFRSNRKLSLYKKKAELRREMEKGLSPMNTVCIKASQFSLQFGLGEPFSC